MDYGHRWTDEELKKLERRISREYTQAAKEVSRKLTDHMNRFAKKDAAKLSKLSKGEITQAEYNRWRLGQIMMGKRWKEMRDTLSQDMEKTWDKTDSMTKEFSYDAYALNHNYGTFEVEKGSLLDTSYTLYDRNTVERLIRDDPDLLPPPGGRVLEKIGKGKAIRWDKQQIQSVMTQGILQGESIDKIAKRMRKGLGESYTIDDIKNINKKTAEQVAEELERKNRNAAIRNARTMTTGAENAGRVNSYKRAVDMGIEMEQMWDATLDGKTRPAHRQLDGQKVKVGEPFKVDGEEIRFPGDPHAPAGLVYNCRCTLMGIVSGIDIEKMRDDIRKDVSIEGMNYEQWKKSKPKPKKKGGG